MGVLNNVQDSADARVAFQAVYNARFPLPPQYQHQATSNFYQRRPFSEEIGGSDREVAQAVDRKVIGRQAFLLDEVLQHAEDGRIVRLPLQHSYSYDGKPSYRGEPALWELLDNEPMSRFGWRIDPEPEDLQEYQKHLLAQRMATNVERGYMGVSIVNAALQNEPEHGGFLSRRLAEEMYHMYIKEEA